MSTSTANVAGMAVVEVNTQFGEVMAFRSWCCYVKIRPGLPDLPVGSVEDLEGRGPVALAMAMAGSLVCVFVYAFWLSGDRCPSRCSSASLTEY